MDVSGKNGSTAGRSASVKHDLLRVGRQSNPQTCMRIYMHIHVYTRTMYIYIYIMVMVIHISLANGPAEAFSRERKRAAVKGPRCRLYMF